MPNTNLSDDPRLTDAGYPMQIGNQEFLACMYTDRDFDEVLQWVRSRYINIASDAAARNPEPESAQMILSVAIQQATQIYWDSDYTSEILWTVEGIMRRGYQMLR